MTFHLRVWTSWPGCWCPCTSSSRCPARAWPPSCWRSKDDLADSCLDTGPGSRWWWYGIGAGWGVPPGGWSLATCSWGHGRAPLQLGLDNTNTPSSLKTSAEFLFWMIPILLASCDGMFHLDPTCCQDPFLFSSFSFLNLHNCAERIILVIT